MKALILVDLQNDFLPGGALPVANGNVILPIINQIQKKFSLVIATKDFHPPNHISFTTSHPHSSVGDCVSTSNGPQIIWPIHCVQGTKGSEFSPLLDTSAIHTIFYKGTQTDIDSYSTFFDNANLYSTGLDDFLKEKGIKELYFTGLATDYCVKFSVLDALNLGYRCHVITDGCKGIDLNKGDIQEALNTMSAQGASLILSNEI